MSQNVTGAFLSKLQGDVLLNSMPKWTYGHQQCLEHACLLYNPHACVTQQYPWLMIRAGSAKYAVCGVTIMQLLYWVGQSPCGNI